MAKLLEKECQKRDLNVPPVAPVQEFEVLCSTTAQFG